MGKVSQYLLSLIVCAMICGLINSLMEKNKTLHTIIKLLTGLVMLLTVLRPLIDINVTNIFSWSQDIHAQAQQLIKDTQTVSAAQQFEYIKSRTEQYIIENAKALGANITAHVELDAENQNIPCAVKITGIVSPYTKARLSQKIADDLGIQREAQIWTG